MENTEKKSKKIIFPIIMGVILLGAAFFGISKYMYAQKHEDTDDAQLETNISPVLPRVSGYVAELSFDDNQHISKGQILVKLDDRDMQIRVAQAEAALQNAVANLATVKANLATAHATLASSNANIGSQKVKDWKASQDYSRYNNLLKEKAITQQQFDAIKADKETAESQLVVAQKQAEVAQMQTKSAAEQIAVAEANIKARQADLDYAKLQLSYCQITAPSSGVISKRNIQLGQYVQAGQSLFSIVADSSLWVVANFKETQLKNMKIGQPVEITIDAFDDMELKGEVLSFSGATGARFSLLPPDNATGNFVKVVQRVPVKIKINASAEQMSILKAGLSAKVVVNTAVEAVSGKTALNK